MLPYPVQPHPIEKEANYHQHSLPLFSCVPASITPPKYDLNPLKSALGQLKIDSIIGFTRVVSVETVSASAKQL